MQSFPLKIRISVEKQELELLEKAPLSPVSEPDLREGSPEPGWVVLKRYPVSTSGYGLGTEPGSLKTPLGRFIVAEMFGEDAPLGAVFKGRVFTGEIAPFEDPESEEDLITTRILWLSGIEPHNANTYSRYIYIHGTNHEERIGTPASHGCIRMRNRDIAELYPLVFPGIEVEIRETAV